jgi:very-short-patch-repair endonuclease
MRRQIVKVSRKNSTKYERRFLELLKENRVKFFSKVKIGGREVDFICGKYAIDIDGHKQDPLKNELLVNCGFIPVHYDNKEVKKDLKIDYLKV